MRSFLMKLIARRVSDGFTLIELMVVVAIIGVLGTIVIPSYYNQVQKSRRTDAKASLMLVAQQLERCFTEKNSYAPPGEDEDENAGCRDYTGGVDSNEGFYTVTATAQNASAFTLQATAKGAQADDTNCYHFILDNLGQKISKDNAETPNPTTNCW